ncbi:MULTISPECIES: ABC transporter permease [unclassified Rhizobium]|uniref:ABC transporter permease n=1 Tax=unclassified Rhizobium TaxID=2613769 RepID=UPI0007E948CD|nr:MULTISPECIES: ABC-2 family transporter protein [unclassified Rhizobium]ANM11074.1 ABC-2 type transporter permease protein [Rhizobium sp. N324]ANM17616.1 ABC-2 type transporter permease protein [Rhizobium sp. N541]ANM24001.1 ABC-2 type transporter permease protein [Rhizobium sp. N941]OYD04675.1 ABC-2 type transporter permease protein [Rhizobium sp. N4311]
MLLHHLRVIPLLVRMHIRSQMEYRGAFWLDRLAQILSYGSVFATIGILLARFDTLGGWSWPELALLYSFQLLAYSLGAAMSFTQLRDLEELVRLGTYDALLVKPFSPWVYLIFSGLNIGYAGHIILAVPLLGWAVFSVDFAWSVPSALFLVAALFSATLLTAALITMIGATALIWVRSNHLFSIFFGFWELMRYPLNIFPGSIQITLLTAVPLALTSSVPVAALLGKPVPILGDWAGPAALAAGPVWVLIAMVYWRYATGKYQGAGG